MTNNGDNRLLHDIEGMEHFMANDRGWTRCRGCLRLRSTTDEHDVCPACQPGVADGTITLADPSTEPPILPADDHVADPGWIDRGQPIAPAPSEPMVAEPKQKPVKRRWYRRRP